MAGAFWGGAQRLCRGVEKRYKGPTFKSFCSFYEKVMHARPLMRGPLTALVVGALAILALPTYAQTPPISGAEAKPVDLPLSLPFTAGEQVEIVAGYGPGNGSNLHRDTNRTDKANDHYALDLVLPQHANHGKGQPVLAALPGKVVRASWATSGWANYGLRVIIRTDHSDGHTYHALYAHLDQLTVQEGQDVVQGQQIGTLGDSCEGDSQNRDCPFFIPHLHFALHQDSVVGGSGTGGSYGGHAVVPEVIDGYTNLSKGQILTSQNNGSGMVVPICPVENGEKIVEENNAACFRRVTTYWWDGSGGHAGGHIYTYAIPDAQPDTQGWWRFDITEANNYDVHVYHPSAAQSKQARYQVLVDNQAIDTVVLDQTTSPDSWVKLGTYMLAPDSKLEINLADNTGEAFNGVDAPGSKRVAFDAARVRLAGSTMPDPPDMGMPPARDMGTSSMMDMGMPPVSDMGRPPIGEDMPDRIPRPDMGSTGEEQDMSGVSTADMSDPSGGNSEGGSGQMSADDDNGDGTTVSTGSVCSMAPSKRSAPTSMLGGFMLLILRGVRRRRTTRTSRS